jgi:hypothetical protein
MSAKEIKNEIQMLEPAEKVEIFRWLSKQLHLADLVQGVGGYRASWNPLRVDQKGKSIPWDKENRFIRGANHMGKRARLVYLGPLGWILCDGSSFFASKDGSPIETCKSFDEAIEILARKGGAKVQQAPIVNALRSPTSEQRPWILASELLLCLGSDFNNQLASYPRQNALALAFTGIWRE